VWGTMDKDLSQDFRCELLLGWLDDFKVKAKPLFDAFQIAARSTELGAESLYPLNPGSIDMQFEEERATEVASEQANFLSEDRDSARQYLEPQENTR